MNGQEEQQEGLLLRLHQLPLKRAWTSRRGTTKERWSLVVTVHEDGVRGLGEAPLPLRTTDANRLVREETVRLPSLPVGDLQAAKAELDRSRLAPWLRYGILSALVDHKARKDRVSFAAALCDWSKRSGMPCDPRVSAGGWLPVNGNIGPLEPDDAAAEAVRLVNEGFVALKVKSMGNAQADARRLGMIRRAVGSDVALRLDANGAWEVDEVMDALRVLAPYSLEYVEEPLGEGDLAMRARLAEKSVTPVAWDESVTGPHEAAVLAQTAAALVVKPPRLGGVDRFLGVLAAAMRAGTPVVVSTPLEGAVGRAVDLQLAALAGIKCAHGLATGEVFDEDLASGSEPIVGGRLRLPETPGIGELEPTLGGVDVGGGAGSG